jgi:sugar/nucleoside kinase (ribokinase family)
VARIVGVGNPLWDIFAPAQTNAALVDRFGRATVSHVDAAVMQELLGSVRDAVWVPGGGARNTLSLLAALGRDTYLTGTVGADVEGDRYRIALSHDGIADCLTEAAYLPTGTSLTLFSSSGRSTLVVAPGAAQRLEPTAVAPIADPSFVVFEGFLAARADIVEAMLSYLSRTAATLVVDLGHPGVAAAAARVVEAVHRRRPASNPPPIVFGTEAEVTATASSLAAGVSYLRSRADVLVVKRGARGATVYHDAHKPDASVECAAETESELPTVDATGAGDLFAGAFLEARLRGLSSEVACRVGALAARLSLAEYGGHLSRTRIEHLEAAFVAAG